MNVLLTGSTGFLGKKIVEENKDCDFVFLNRQSEKQGEKTIICDLSSEQPILPLEYCFDIVIHVAGKAHFIPRTEHEKKLFYQVNTDGTINLLKSLNTLKTKPKAFIFISTVAVYGLSQGVSITEDAPLMADDPYGHSKVLAENAVLEWGKQHNICITILRLPLVIGEQPLGNLKAIIQGIQKGYYFSIGEGKAKKSMVLATDVAKIMKVVAPIGGIYNLTDGYHPSFRELEITIALSLNKRNPFIMPFWVAKWIGFVGAGINTVVGKKIVPLDNSTLKKIVSPLTFSDGKARKAWGWSSHHVLDSF